MSSIEPGLYEAVLRELSDDAPRLVYAKWLGEQGHEPRAEFIRTQIHLASGQSCVHRQFEEGCLHCEFRRSEENLLLKYGEKWLACLPGSGWKWRGEAEWLKEAQEPSPESRVACFRRGFVTFVTLTTEQFIDCAHLLINQHPIERVRLSDRWPRHHPERGFSWVFESYPLRPKSGFSEVIDNSPECLRGDLISGEREWWNSASEALDDVSAGCVKFGREYRNKFGGMRVFLVFQAAKVCGVSPDTVSEWFDSGRLRGYRIPDANDIHPEEQPPGGMERRIPSEELIRFIQEERIFPLPLIATTPTIKPLTISQDFAEERRKFLDWVRPRVVFTIPEVSQILEYLYGYPISTSTVTKWIDSGKLPVQDDGLQRVVPRYALRRFLENVGIRRHWLN
jgi:uncharacterized protein (TIGR02996 family)